MLKRWNGFFAVMICSSMALGCRGKQSKKNNESDNIVTPTPYPLRTSGDLSQATLTKRVTYQFKEGNSIEREEEFFNEKGLLITQVGFKISAEGKHEEISRGEFSYDQRGKILKWTWVSETSQQSTESTFDATGRLLKMMGKTNGTLSDGGMIPFEISESREYDAHGKLMKADYHYGKYSESIFNEWDSSGRIASTVFYRNGVPVHQNKCTFDDKGRIIRVESLLALKDVTSPEESKRKQWSTVIDWDQNLISTEKTGRTDLELRKGFQMEPTTLDPSQMECDERKFIKFAPPKEISHVVSHFSKFGFDWNVFHSTASFFSMGSDKSGRDSINYETSCLDVAGRSSCLLKEETLKFSDQTKVFSREKKAILVDKGQGFAQKWHLEQTSHDSENSAFARKMDIVLNRHGLPLKQEYLNAPYTSDDSARIKHTYWRYDASESKETLQEVMTNGILESRVESFYR
jgi:antitoxin component YwqK of YwqJK toxin-antitoxin module